jgi:hypothetical protein
MSQPIRLGILSTLLLSGILIAFGQQQLSGSYKMYVGEQPFSEEKFVLTINADDSRRSEAEVMIGPRKSKVITVAAGNRPVSFSVETGDLELAQTLTAGGNKEVRLRILPNLTHIFTPSGLDKSVSAEAAAEVSPDFLQGAADLGAQRAKPCAACRSQAGRTINATLPKVI